MPRYTIKHNETGKTITFDWEGKEAPTEKDIEEVYDQALSMKQPEIRPSQPDLQGNQLGILGHETGLDYLKKNLDLAGMTAGSMGAMPLSPAAGPLAPLVPVAGGILGAITGRGIQRIGEGQPMTAQDYMKPGQAGAMAEMGGPLLGKLVSKVAAPFASRITEEGKNLLRLVKEKNLPISPSTIAPSLPARAGEAIVNKVPVVNSVTKFYQNKLQNNLTKTAEEIRVKYSNEALDALEQAAINKYEQAFDAIAEPKIQIKNFLGAIEKAKGNMSRNAKATADAILIEAGEAGAVSVEAAKRLKKQVGTLGGKNLDLKRNLNQSLIEDITGVDGGEAAAIALKEGNLAYRYKQKVGRVTRIFNQSFEFPKNPETGMAMKELFNPAKFEKAYNQEIRKTISKELPDIVPALDELLLISRAAKKDLAKVGGRSLIDLGTAGIGTGILSILDPGKLPYLAPLGAGAMGARSMLAPKGLARKWLTEGIKFPQRPGFQEGLKMGGRYIMTRPEE